MVTMDKIGLEEISNDICMKKLFATLLLLFVFNTNTFSKDSIEWTTKDERQMYISFAIIGTISGVAGTTILIKSRNADDLSKLDMVMLGAPLINGFILLFVSGLGLLSLNTEEISSIPENNSIVKHLQLGILPNAKAGYTGIKFNF
ncbi:MAG: hypothetical protein LBH25_03460 [Fibromonadaceae bacterium]|jgi:hypothetical protein|nr:hypothetical protein [Fibromonadaceae bacterium]